MPIRVVHVVLALVVIVLASSPLLATSVSPVSTVAMSKNGRYHVIEGYNYSNHTYKYSIYKEEDTRLFYKTFSTEEFSAKALWTFSREWYKEGCWLDATAVSDDARVVVMSIRQSDMLGKGRLEFRNANGVYATAELTAPYDTKKVTDDGYLPRSRLISITIDGDKAIIEHELYVSYFYYWWRSFLGEHGPMIGVSEKKDVHRCIFALADGALIESQNLPDKTTRIAYLFGYRCNASVVITLVIVLGCLAGGTVSYGVWRLLKWYIATSRRLLAKIVNKTES